MKNLIIVLFITAISSYSFAQQTFQLNATGPSYIYWPFPNSSFTFPNNWAIRGYNNGEGDHLGGDWFAEDWGLPGSQDCDSVIKSPLDGTVIFSGYGGETGYGIQVVIRSSVNNQFAFRVCHLSSSLVSMGSNVSAGQVIGRIGTTGSSTGCHAHTALYKNITSIYSGTTTAVQRLQSGLGLGFSGPANQFAAKYYFSAVQSSNVTGVFRANGNIMPSVYPYWKFWKTINYQLTVTLNNLPSGWGWSLYLVKPNGSSIMVTNGQYGNTYTNNNFLFPNDNSYPNSGNYFLKVTKNGLENDILCISPQFFVSSLPVLSSLTIHPVPISIGQTMTINWVVTGGIEGEPAGGWTGNIRFQFYKGDTALSNLAYVPVGNGTGSFTFSFPNVSGIFPPRCNIRIAGVNADSGTSMPGGSVYRFTEPFCVFPLSNTSNSENSFPNETKLYQNNPNPFNPETKISIDIPDKKEMNLEIFDITGKKVSTLFNGIINPGKHEFLFNGKYHESGIYFVKMKTNNYSITRRMILIK